MTMISLSGLDLSFLHGSAGGHPPPRRPASAKRTGARLTSGDGAIVIDLAKKRIELRGPASAKTKAAAVKIAATAKAKQAARAKKKRRRQH